MDKKKLEDYNSLIFSMLPQRCVINGGNCSLIADKDRRNGLIEKQPYAFIMRPYLSNCLDMENACKKLIKDYYVVRNASSDSSSSPTRNEIGSVIAKDNSFIGHGFCQICSLCQYSFFGVAELGHLNPNVMLEIGLMFAFSKAVIFTLDKRLNSIEEVPFDLNGMLLVLYDNEDELISGLKSKIDAVMIELKRKELI
jgi:hypothetical protein